VTILQSYLPCWRSLSNSLVVSSPVRKYAKNHRTGLRESIAPQKTDTTASTTSMAKTLVAMGREKKQIVERKCTRDADVEKNENQ